MKFKALLIVALMLSQSLIIFSQTDKVFPNHIVSVTPQYIYISLRDTISNNFDRYLTLNARLSYQKKIKQTLYLGGSVEYFTSNNIDIGKGNGYGFGLNGRKFWNFELYNKNCKPIFKNRIYFSSMAEVRVANYKYNDLQNKFLFSNSPSKLSLALYPLNIDIRLLKRLMLHTNLELIMTEPRPAFLVNKNLGISFFL